MILLAVWAIAPVELPLTVAIAKTADFVKQCFEKITASEKRAQVGCACRSESYFVPVPKGESAVTDAGSIAPTLAASATGDESKIHTRLARIPVSTTINSV